MLNWPPWAGKGQGREGHFLHLVLETELCGFRALTHHLKTKPYCEAWGLLMDMV